ARGERGRGRPGWSFGLLLRLLDWMTDAGLRRSERLLLPGWPDDDCLLNLRFLAQPEVQRPHVLRGVAIAAGNLLQLFVELVFPPVLPVQSYLSSDGAAVTGRTLQVELNPLVVLV